MTDLDAQYARLRALVATIRDGADWPTAVDQVTDQIEAMTADEVSTLLLVACLALAGVDR